MNGTGGNKLNFFGRRGVSPLIGIVLLFGIVAVGVLLLFAVGVPMLDAFESESERERAHLCMDEADHRFATVAATGEQQSMPDTDISDCQLGVANDGQIDIIWYNESEATGDINDLPWDDDDRTATVSLGALEFELDDRTIAHQGGGIWELTGEQTTVISEPGISYNNESESVQFGIMQIDEDELSGTDPIARANHDKTRELAADINEAADNSDGNNVAIRIESAYHDGWNRHLRTAFLADEKDNISVTHEPRSETVLADIAAVREMGERPDIVVAADYGLQGPRVFDNRIAHPDYGGPSSDLELRAKFENIGDGTKEKDLGFEIIGHEINERGNPDVELDSGDTETKTLSIPPGQYRHELDPGNTYEYQITVGSDPVLSDPGSFYIGTDESYFSVTDDDIETTPTGDRNTTISATIRNLGVENATAQDISLEFDHPDITGVEQELALDYGADGTVEWTINENAWPNGNYPFTIETEDGDEAMGILEIENGQVGDGFAITGDYGVFDGPGDTGDQRVDVTQSMFTIGTEITNTNYESETQEVTLLLPDEAGSEPDPEVVTLESNESEIVEFDLETDDFEAGTVYKYNVSTEDNAMTTPGSFYAGKSGTHFDPSDTNTTRDDGTVTITADISNLGIETGSQAVGFELEYLDELPEELDGNDPYGHLGESAVDRSFGESDTIKLELNQSKLLDGEYEATIHTDDGSDSVEFAVDAGIDPGRVGLGKVEDAEVTVEVIGSQVSGDRNSDHQLAPMTLDIVTNGETEHSFNNPNGGDNINTGSSWQHKNDESYEYTFTVDNKETELTLRNTRYSSETWSRDGWRGEWRMDRTCNNGRTDPDDLPHYSGPTHMDLTWCNTVPDDIAFGPIDASQDQNLQNVRVRSAKENTIPALPAGTDQQLSATEVLKQRGLVANGSDELDLGSGEFVFLFENTESTHQDGIDALWNDAIATYEQNPDETYDPNFNDLTVYVEVERAGVDPGTPSITIMPGGGDQTDVDRGESDTTGEVGDIDIDFGEGTATVGESPTVGTGESTGDGPDSQTGETGINADTEYIVIG